MTNLWQLDATAQAALVEQGEVHPRELVQVALRRIEDLNPTINAVCGLDAERALQRAEQPLQGPFAGVPFLIKDVLGYPGFRHAFGSRTFAGNVATEATPYTERLDEAGLIVLGKSTTSELGLLGSTETALDGITRNPWDLELSAGGSSGGAAAAVASGMVPFAHASDGGGSIRLPAALCGLFGFKPSRGRTVRAVPFENDFTRLVSEHCVSRSVRDSARDCDAVPVHRLGRCSPALPPSRAPEWQARRLFTRAVIPRTGSAPTRDPGGGRNIPNRPTRFFTSFRMTDRDSCRR